jgi:cytochrome P450
MLHKERSPFTFMQLRRHYTEPHNLYHALRAHQPFHFDEISQAWLVTGHAENMACLDNPSFISHLDTHSSPVAPGSVQKQILFMDGDLHQQAQQVILKSLSQLMKHFSGTLRGYIQTCLQKVGQKGSMDVVADFAAPISLFSIAQILGIPTDNPTELHRLECWSDTFADISSGYFTGNNEDIVHLESYFRQLIARKRQALADDLLSTLIEAADIFPAEEDLIANCMMIFAAGRITTKKALGNGISLLLPQWEQWQALVHDTPRALGSLREELLRMITPTRYLVRQAHVQTTIASRTANTIETGQKVICFLEAANRDPQIFDRPDLFDPARAPNKHMAFGYGPHQCPGAAMARTEIHIALEALLQLSSVHSQSGASVVWSKNPNLGGYTANPVQFTPFHAL